MTTSTFKFKIHSDDHTLAYRRDSVGDRGVIKQILIDRDYDITRWEQGKKLIKYWSDHQSRRPGLIIDAGANIGASAVYFSANYKNTLVYNIEPDDENYNLLELNTRRFNCFNFRGAISSRDGELWLSDPGRSDWGFTTSEHRSSEHAPRGKSVASICPRTIMTSQQAIDHTPLIFKIDIEGAESELFSLETNWLGEFPLIIIELHDWMLPFQGSSKNFFRAMNQFDFDFLHKGENIFLFNRKILNKA